MNDRRRLEGKVTSNKMMKTVVVEIGRTYRHPLYKKVVHSSRRVKAQDDLGCEIGDLVQIVETRPLSKDKCWAVETILKHKTAQIVTTVEEEVVVTKSEGEPA
jgi:small subunit ribosomal protein S17